MGKTTLKDGVELPAADQLLGFPSDARHPDPPPEILTEGENPHRDPSPQGGREILTEGKNPEPALPQMGGGRF